MSIYGTKEYERLIAEAMECVPDIGALRGKRILITGAGGLICSTVSDMLLELNRNKAFGMVLYLAGRSAERMKARFSHYEEGRDYCFVPYEATSPMAPEVVVDYVIHGAGNATPALYAREPVETMLGNLVGTNTLLSLTVKTGTKRFLYISSSEVYGQRLQAPYKEEDMGYVDIKNPRAACPCAKRAAETLCAAYAAEYGVDTVIVRPGHIYGPAITEHDDRAFAQFIRRALAGEDIVMKSAGRQVRSYCHSLDCASAILTVLLRGQSGNAYNISNSESICTISDVAHALAKITGVKVTHESATKIEQKSYNMMSNSSLASEKLEGLGWNGLFDLKRGIAETVQIMKNCDSI